MSKKQLMVAWLIIILFSNGCATFSEKKSVAATKTDAWIYGYYDGYYKSIEECRYYVKNCGKCSQNWDKHLADNPTGMHPRERYAIDNDYLESYSFRGSYDLGYRQGFDDAYKSCKQEVDIYCPKGLESISLMY